MSSDNSFYASDNMLGANNTPTIQELFEACEHLGDHISYNSETNKMYPLNAYCIYKCKWRCMRSSFLTGVKMHMHFYLTG